MSRFQTIEDIRTFCRSLAKLASDMGDEKVSLTDTRGSYRQAVTRPWPPGLECHGPAAHRRRPLIARQ